MAENSDAAKAPVSTPAEPVVTDDGPAAKRVKLDSTHHAPASGDSRNKKKDDASPTKQEADNEDGQRQNDTRKGLAPIKKEYESQQISNEEKWNGTENEREPLLIRSRFLVEMASQRQVADDDAAEGRSEQLGGDARDAKDADGSKPQKGKRKKQKGQNTERSFGRFDDDLRLCNSRAYSPEFSPKECRYGDKCRLLHDLRKYLDEGRRDDVETFGGKCPVFEKYGECRSGWKCRFVRSHMQEVEREDGRKELVLQGRSEDGQDDGGESRPDVGNVVPMSVKIELNRKRTDFSKADSYIKWLNKEAQMSDNFNNHRQKDQTKEESMEEMRAQFVDPPFKASEKRRLYFGPETPVLAPLTTQGNLPFRRLCVELGAQLTYSEMALGLPLLQGTNADWALMKAHETELQPPRVSPPTTGNGNSTVPVFDNGGYDHARDIRFGAQISASQPWVAVKAADALSRFCPQLRLIDLNCGCPIDMVYKSGGGSALLDSHGKLERMIRGMNAVSGEVPVTAKIRTGVRQNRPTAWQVMNKLAFGGREHRERLGAPGCAAITLHGRSREQRYTKRADWGFIAESAALVKTYNEELARLTDTAAEPDPRTQPSAGRLFFIGNGDCYSHVDYQNHIDEARVDSVMVGRGALIKPWLFEEIEKGQYLDKSASERLTYIEKFVRYGLEAWGSDELGIGFTRRFLLEWLSFSHRYIPVGLLEHLPPNLNDRPPAYRGRNDLETLLASDNYLDWIKISEMFLGPVHPGFKFQPKHKSNAYETEG
ncbi:tRNA-dihydrouridine synthase 3 [Geosmithia morbida]|uniref:tRNA-dihydrouridine(47) synthase [NAD(P)(+)] n=1 Tax=Geosmithia morbida TaxID=1094350 RepID=A0A9P4YYY7_9HYPO|nr:tRNA-dihydrouridine synthase 3 [Geosmithia morbida]KAF4125097.1 tRNA-dihydrouridine synthase 3 [Geosmithia morbida]